MKKALTIVGLFIGINATAQVATSGTNNSGTNASAMGYQTSATNTASTAMGNSSTSKWRNIYSNGLSNICNKYRLNCNGK